MKRDWRDDRLYALFAREQTIPESMQARLDACYDKILGESGPGEGDKRPVRKGVKTALLIAAVVALLAGSAVASAELNLFEMFGAMGRPEYAAVASDASALEDRPAVIDDEYGCAEARVDSIYYNGRELAMTYSFRIGGDYYGSFAPDGEMLSRMEKKEISALPDSGIDRENTAVSAFMTAVESQSGEPAGFVRYAVSLSDHTKTPDGVDAGVWRGGFTEPTEEGFVSEVREFESPLPAELQEQDKITLTTVLRRVGYFYYYDGQDVYYLREVVLEEEMTASAHRSEAETATYTGTGEYGGVPCAVTAVFGTFGGEITVTAENAVFTPRCFVVAWDEKGVEYTWTGYRQRQENTDTLTYAYDSQGYLPQELTVLIFEWPEDVEYRNELPLNREEGIVLAPTGKTQ